MIINYSYNINVFFKEAIISSFLIHQKKIIIAVSIIFAGLAIYTITRRTINAKLVTKHTPQKEELKIKKEKNPQHLEKSKLEKQLDLAQQVDTKASENGWKQGLGKAEKEETLEQFKISPHSQVNAHLKSLKIVIFENIPTRDLEIIHIVKDYLSVIHGLETTIAPNPLKLYQVYVRQKANGPQYPVENHLELLKREYPDHFALGFTDKDLYPLFHANKINFIFGIGNNPTATGLFSTCRYSSDTFEQALKRLMKLASHEFAHMRGILHCTKYVCTMQGTNSLEESDQIPLTFCAQDMAKICYLNQWSLKEAYENQLNFFENFFSQYDKKVDFSFEIKHLKKKIAKLEPLGE